MKTKINTKLTRRIRVCIWIVIVGLILSGLTAFPIETELKILYTHTSGSPAFIRQWLGIVYHAVNQANTNYPFLAYGTDWLAFAHLLLAVLFTGILKDPLRNIWVIEFGMIASVAIFPLALIAGSIREIPLFWQFIDCSFGMVTLLILVPCYRMCHKLMVLAGIH